MEIEIVNIKKTIKYSVRIVIITLVLSLALFTFLQIRSHPDIPDYKSYIIPPKKVLQNKHGSIISNTVGALNTSIISVVNFRDIGGYSATKGKMVKYDCIYRSGDLSRIDAKDLSLIENIGIKTVYDLRHTGEVEELPNDLPKSIKQVHIPIYNADEQPGGLWRTISRYNLDHYWEEFYVKTLIDDNAKHYGELINTIVKRDNYPIVIHCTAGKDRTGIAIALILLAIGVPEDTVIADYTLSNNGFPRILAYAQDKFNKHPVAMSILNIEAIDLYPFFLAKRRTISISLDHIKNKYGTYENYLIKAADVDPKSILLLKNRLLEEHISQSDKDDNASK